MPDEMPPAILREVPVAWEPKIEPEAATPTFADHWPDDAMRAAAGIPSPATRTPMRRLWPLVACLLFALVMLAVLWLALTGAVGGPF